MDYKKVLASGWKFFVNALGAELVVVLSLGLQHTPDSPLGVVIFQYLIAPALTGLIGMARNYLKHKNDPV